MPKPTREELKIEIAKDVLKQIQLHRIYAQTGTYFTWKDDIYPKFKTLRNKPRQLRDILKQGYSCNVCALGALFISYARLHNKVSCNIDDTGRVEHYYGSGEMKDTLKNIFINHELSQIEAAFEGWDGIVYRSARTFGNNIIYNLHNEYDNDTAVLKGIMSNIIENNGTFTP